MSKYPAELDDDSSLPSVIDGATDNSAEAIESLRAAVLAIEREIGNDPAGSVATLVQRLSVALNDDGTLKASALLAAGLIALPITNSQISSSAAISESKLDLAVGTQALQDQITSNDIDISTLQTAILELLSRFVSHVAGDDYLHDGYQILLDADFPDSSPDWLYGFDATTVSDFIAAMSLSYNDHLTGANAHTADQIAVEAGTGLAADNLQDALAELAGLRAAEIAAHVDSNHSNGISAWSNDPAGYDTKNIKIPQTAATVSAARVLNLGTSVAGLMVGDFVVSADSAWQIAAIGPANSVGALPALTSTEVLVFGDLGTTGTINVTVYGAASVANLRAPLAAGLVDGGGVAVDALAMLPPNAARAVSLGADPRFIDTSSTISITVGTASGSRSLTVSNLDLDRSGVSVSPTLQTVSDRLNIAFQAAAMPAVAAVVGDELAISATQQETYSTLLISAASKFLGFADVVGATINPTVAGSYTVAGSVYSEFPLIVSGSGQIIGGSVPISNTAAYGLRPGHRLHVLDSDVAAAEGTYRISAVGPNSVTISPVPSTNTATYHVLADTVPLADFSGQTGVVQVFVGANGKPYGALRATTADTISGVRIISVSDGFTAGPLTLQSAASGSDRTIGIVGAPASVTLRASFTGTVKVYGVNNVDWLELGISATIGTGTSAVTVLDGQSEEENLELYMCRFDGTRAQQISDRRLFGNLGLDELREDVVQAYVESPTAELRSNGAVRGFGLTSATGIDGSAPGFDYPAGTQLLLVDGGTAYVGGARVSQNTQYVAIPPTNGTYTVILRPTGYFAVIPDTQYSVTELIEGLGGHCLVIATVVRTSGPVAISAQSLVRYITRLDDRVDQVIDLTNSFVGNFASVGAAIAHANAAPDGELTKFNIVSYTDDPLEISGLTANMSLEISGAVGAVAIDSNIDICGVPDRTRTTPHIASIQVGGTTPVESASFAGLIVGSVDVDVSAATAGAYSFVDCVFAENAAITVTGANAASLRFLRCSSIGSLNITATISGSIVIEDCDFVCGGGTLSCQSADTRISRTSLDNGILALGSSGSATISGLLQKNNTDTTILSGTAAVWLDQYECVDASASNPQFVQLAAGTVNGAIFTNIAITGVSGGAALIEADAISSLNVSSVTTTVPTPLVQARSVVGAEFVDCQYSEIRASALVRGAIGVNCVRKIDTASTTRLVVDQCDLVMSADASPAIAIADGYQIVRECSFDFGANTTSGQLAVQFTGSNTVDVGIFDSSFVGANVDGDGPYGGGFGIDFLNLQNTDLVITAEISELHRVIVDRCDFRGIQAVKPNSAPLSALMISNCKSEGLFDIQVANNFDMIANEMTSLVLRGSTSAANISNNKFKIAAQLQGTHSRMVFDSNSGVLTIDCTLSNCRFSGFSGSVTALAGAAAQDTNFADMSLDDSSDLSELLLTRSRFIGCTFDGHTEFNINSGGSVDSCKFGADVVVGGTPVAFSYANNTSSATPGAQVNFAPGVQACRITSNIGFSMIFEDGVSESTIGGNTRLDGYLEFIGSSLADSAITGNYYNSIAISTETVSAALFGQNIVAADMSFADSLATAQYSDVSIVSNKVGGSLEFGRAASSAGGVVTFSNLVLDNNTAAALRFAENLGSGSPSIAFSNVFVSSLFSPLVSFGSEDTTPDFNGASVSFDGVILSSSTVGTFALRGSRPNASTSTAAQYSRFVMSSCDFTSIYIGRESDLYTDPMSHAAISDFAFVGCRSAASAQIHAITVDGLSFVDFVGTDVEVFVLDGSTSLGGTFVSAPDIKGVSFTNSSVTNINFAGATTSASPSARNLWIVDTRITNTSLVACNFAGSTIDGIRNIKGMSLDSCRFETDGVTAAGLFVTHEQSTTELSDVIVSSCFSSRDVSYAISYQPNLGASGVMDLSGMTIVGCQNLELDVDVQSSSGVVVLQSLNLSSSSVSEINISTNKTMADIGINGINQTSYGTGAVTIGGNINGLTLTNSFISGNVVITGDTVNGMIISSNDMTYSLNLAGLGNASNSIKSLHIVSNNAADIELPPIARLDAGETQTKIIGNTLLNDFVCASAFTLSAKAGAVFAWGNTSSGAVNVTFDGTTATNTATANNLAGLGITA